jgi:nitroimidazol reductase NimA-like FMN-containing flavoprotein (pyridoxamine 5'-phosphate oxidase superfamily)
MAILDARTWLEHLSPAECWRLLALTPVGRLGVLVDSAPEIYPVNHVVDDQSIVFRTDPGSKLRGLDRSPSVCFEVDELDPSTATGWSVLLKGKAAEITDGADLERARELPLRFWVVGERDHWIRVTPVEVTGRRIVVGKERPASPTAQVISVEEIELDLRGYL